MTHLSLDYELHIRKKDLFPNTHSPLRDDYPEGNFNRSVADTEEAMHTTWDVQYRNWSTPYTAVKLLEIFRTEQILPVKFHDFLWNTMVESTTGLNKIKALLPAGTVVAHKTGSSFRNQEGLNAAENDIAIIRLPDGRYYSLAVFVADSWEDEQTNVGMIAQISKAVYDYLAE